MVAGRIAPHLVIALAPPEAESVPGCRRAPVELEQPQPSPATLVRDRGETAMELLPPAEVGGCVGPASPVEGKQRVHALLELGLRLRRAVAEVVRQREPPLQSADLLAQVRG